MDRDRIDFSALDPSRDAERWDRLVRATAARAMEARRPAHVLAGLVASWRPALALAAAAAVLAWVPAILSTRGSSAEKATPPDPVLSTASWALRARSEAAADLVEAIGADHGR